LEFKLVLIKPKTKTMKKLVLCFLVSASLIACKNQETKKADASVDKNSGTFTSIDKKSEIIKQITEGYLTGDTSINYPLVSDYYSDTVKVYLHMADSQENGKTKETQGGKEFVYGLSSNHHALYSNINMTMDKIKTLAYNDGRVITTAYTLWSGTGKFTKEAATVPVHQAYHWSGDKIVRFDMFYDPTNLNKEIAAATKK
jgi:uncharacterized lipoprotein YehR (DUF1307 family)